MEEGQVVDLWIEQGNGTNRLSLIRQKNHEPICPRRSWFHRLISLDGSRPTFISIQADNRILNPSARMLSDAL